MYRSKNKSSSTEKMAALMFLMIMDFIFTYIGINYLQFIIEANPVLVSLFEMPVVISLLIRLVHMVCIYVILKYISTRRFKLYNGILNFGLIINSIVLIMHVNWILRYALST